MQFDHIGLSVSSLEHSKAFYANVLEFSMEESRFELAAHQLRGLILLNRHGVRLELFERQGSQRKAVGHPTESTLTQGFFQFAMRVKGVEQAFKKAVAAGATPVFSPRLAPDGRSIFAFIADPDGNLIEFLQRDTRLA